MTAETAPPPLDLLGERWDRAVRVRLEEILRRYGDRLSSGERSRVREEAASATGGALQALRRRLLHRLWKGAFRPRNPLAFGAREQEIGPYNDRAALEDVLQRAAGADSLWVREFLDLYVRMERLRKSFLDLVPVAR